MLSLTVALALTSTKAVSKTDDDDITGLVNSLKKTSLSGGLKKTSPSGGLPSIFVDSCDDIADLVEELLGLPTSPPSLYLDIEGINLCRHGTVSIIQIFDSTKKLTYLVDIFTLKNEAFTTPGSSGKSLQDILESKEIPKVFFDVRNDSDALHAHFGIKLDGIQDVQLMELATRIRSKRFVNGLGKCIDYDGGLSWKETQECTRIKDKGRRLFAPELGGNYEVFNTRPLAEEIRAYCVQDVQFLPRLYENYDRRLTARWKIRVELATKERVTQSRSISYRPNGRHKALGPW